MFSAVYTGSIRGMEAYPVTAEVDISRGLPGFEVVGSVSGDVREAKERVQIALKNAGISMPVARITVNLAPAHIKKEGTGFDMAIAAGLLCCMGMADTEVVADTGFVGELALDGAFRRVNGVLPIALSLMNAGVKKVLVPEENLGEGVGVKGLHLVGIRDIKELVRYLQMNAADREREFAECREYGQKKATAPKESDFEEVYGQEGVKRAAEVAAAGFHHLLIAGAPGTGKTMIAKRIAGILPPLTEKERMEVLSIYSIAGKTEGMEKFFTMRPFVSPHHTITPRALAGGGRVPRPGMLSLAHRGVLFLDEMPEFVGDVLEVLRQPLEEKQVHIARSQGVYTYPADFMLVCAMNPCPCGYFPDKNRCTCTETEIRRYLGKISGPILDRIDIITEAAPVCVKDFHKKNKGEKSKAIRARVMEARARQDTRYRGSGYHFNGELAGRDVEQYCRLHMAEQRFLEQVYESGQMSVRSYHKVIKLARTVADLDESEEIKVSHLAEAVCYNSGKQRFMM